MDAVMNRIVGHPLIEAECDNVVKIKGKPYVVQPSLVSHEFVVGAASGSDEVVKSFDIPNLEDMPFMLLQYGVKPVAGTVKYDGTPTAEDNRFWIVPLAGKPYGGDDGHQISPCRGKFVNILRPNLHEGRLAVKLKVTPSNATDKKYARVRVLLYFIFFLEAPARPAISSAANTITETAMIPRLGAKGSPAAKNVMKHGKPTVKKVAQNVAKRVFPGRR